MMPDEPEIWGLDTEWGFRDNHIGQESAWEPVVLCAVGLHSHERFYFWGRDPRLYAFFREHARDCFIAHYAVAEMKYLLRLAIPLPERWFDSFVGWRCKTNGPGHLEAGLPAALHGAGLPHIAPAAKKELQQKILHLNFTDADRPQIIDYCFSDCDGCLALYRQFDREELAQTMPHWTENLKAVARMELRGIRFDDASYAAIQARRPLIREALICEINSVYPVFFDGSFHKASFLEWCRRHGIKWPTKVSLRTKRSYPPFDRDTFKEMEHRHPFIAQVREVLKTLSSFEKRSLVVDFERHRHYYSTSVFRSVTGRNQPRNFVFSGPKWLRFLIVPESRDHVLVYVDYIAQEFALAAALSGDRGMREMYQAGDSHMAFAIRAGAAPVGATKATHGSIRNQFKTVNLGLLYGQTSHGIAQRLGISKSEAEVMVDDHRRLARDYWDWSERIVQGSLDRGWIVTPCGWRSRVPRGSNPRTWLNWPMQSAGADIMRLTVTYLDRQNVRILAPVHDGFVLSCRRDQLDDLRQAVDFACSAAVEHVVPGFPLRWDFTVYENRFEDQDGLPLWQKLQSILKGIG
jgi:DNA polymerase I